MKQILLINSPLFEEKNELNKEDYLPPLGLGIIASTLRENGYDVQILDSISENLSVNDILVKINSLKPDLVGINIFTTNFKLVKKIVEETKITTHFLIGGVSTQQLYCEIFKWKASAKIDIVYGDGELIIKDLISESVKEIPLVYDNKRFFKVAKDSCYFVKDISEINLDRTFYKNEPHLNYFNQKEICIYTSRGCVNNCAYCAAANKLNKDLTVRFKSIDSIIRELKEISIQYPDVKVIRILDDLFLINNDSFKIAIKIFNHFDFSWRAMCHIKPLNTIDIDTLKEIKACGCQELFVGIESGSKRILNKIHKESNTDNILKAVEKAFKCGINLKGYFMCGLPSETIDDLNATFGLADKIKKLSVEYKTIFRTHTFQFRPYYGTELFQEIVLKSHMEPGFILFNIKEAGNKDNFLKNNSYNFASGNYSNATDKELEITINKINDLNAKTL